MNQPNENSENIEIDDYLIKQVGVVGISAVTYLLAQLLETQGNDTGGLGRELYMYEFIGLGVASSHVLLAIEGMADKIADMINSSKQMHPN